jgi:hypothetical protein
MISKWYVLCRYVVRRYTGYPVLLGLLLRLLNGDLAWSTRREVLKVQGPKKSIHMKVMHFSFVLMRVYTCWSLFRRSFLMQCGCYYVVWI